MLTRILILVSCLLSGLPAAQAEPSKTFRILHVMSFSSPYRWTDGQLDGFKAGLGKNIKAEFKIFQLDTKNQSSKEEMARNALKARELIDEWKPDLVYTSDDDAVQLVTTHYISKPLPFVFSGVNKSLEDHGIKGASNITGVLEREHILESIHLLQTINPKLRRVQIFSDNGNYWPQVIGRARILARAHKEFELVGVSQPEAYAEFQRLVLANPNNADAYLMLGNFTFKDDKGANVPYPQLQRWMAENSKIPDFSFWDDRMLHGTLAGVTVSAFEQGLAAGKQARAILKDKRLPSSLPVTSTSKGVPVINLARARKLGILPDSTQLLSSTVITSYIWDKP